MDERRFDTLIKLAWTTSSRRSVLGTAIGAVALGFAPDLEAAKRKNQRRRKRKQGKNRPCYPGTDCQLGPGKDNSGCDFTESVAFFEGNVQGSNFSHANFTGAQLAGANMQGADLGDACLVGANLLEADLAGADLDGAIFCQTVMPDGSTNDSGCGNGARCCPTTCEEQGGEECVGGCINTLNQICNNVFGTPCCAPMLCTPSISVIVTSCQQPCTSDADCTIFPNATKCCGNDLLCPFLPGERCCHDPNDPAGCG